MRKLHLTACDIVPDQKEGLSSLSHIERRVTPLGRPIDILEAQPGLVDASISWNAWVLKDEKVFSGRTPISTVSWPNNRSGNSEGTTDLGCLRLPALPWMGGGGDARVYPLSG